MVTVHLSSGCSPIGVMILVLLKVVVLWKGLVLLWKLGSTYWCSVVVVVFQVLKHQAYMWSDSGGTSTRAGSFTMEWCNPMSRRIFFESLMIIVALSFWCSINRDDPVKIGVTAHPWRELSELSNYPASQGWLFFPYLKHPAHILRSGVRTRQLLQVIHHYQFMM